MKTSASPSGLKSRRDFVKLAVGAGLLAAGGTAEVRAAPAPSDPPLPAGDERARWCAFAVRLAGPVLAAPMPELASLAAVLHGLSPWFEHGRESAASELARLARTRLAAIFADSEAPARRARLASGAMLAAALQRAPSALWTGLPTETRHAAGRWFAALAAAPCRSDDDRLFAAVLAVALRDLGLGPSPGGPGAIYAGLRCPQNWADWRGPGERWHWMQERALPAELLLLEALESVAAREPTWQSYRDRLRDRLAHQAALEERLVAPDGTYPLLGWAENHRCGAFQSLAAAAWRGLLPASVRPAQARTALSAVLHRTLNEPAAFAPDGSLLPWPVFAPGSAAPSEAGARYLCCAALLPLGLSALDPFWMGSAQHVTWHRSWLRRDLPA